MPRASTKAGLGPYVPKHPLVANSGFGLAPF
jgi:hypothetical protein